MEEAQSKIDQEISSLLSRVADLRTRRNDMTLLASLQPEVLAEVFRITICCHSTEFSSTASIFIAQLSKVCRGWRAVIQDNPRLWSQIDVRSDGCMRRMLQMSKSALLELRVDVSSGKPQLMKRVQTVLSSARKFSLIHMHCSPNSLAQVCQDVSPDCLGQLEGLYLKNHWLSEESNSLPPVLRDSLGLRLSSLRLDGFTLPSNAPLLSAGALVLLEITLPDSKLGPKAKKETIDQLINLLASLPKLQHLSLKHALPPIPYPLHSRSKISLPNLISLTLHGSVLECVQLLNLLDIRTDRQLVIRATFDKIEEINKLLPIFTAICTQPPLHTLSLTVDYGVGITGWQTLPGSPNFDFHLKASAGQIRDVKNKTISAISPFLRGIVAGLQVLKIVTVSGWTITRKQWANAFGSATSLKTLFVDNVAFDDVVKALGIPSNPRPMPNDIPAADEDGKQATITVQVAEQVIAKRKVRPLKKASSTILWKNLKHIIFDGMTIPSEDASLKEALQRRADAGFALESVAFQGCSVSEEITETLEDIVEVDWDGLEDGAEEVEDYFDDDLDSFDDYDYGYHGSDCDCNGMYHIGF